MKKAVDPSLHVVKISFPNVIKLLEGSNVQWRWKDPNSDFAKGQVSAGAHFEKLVLAKSKPNWVVRISKSETGIDYKFNSVKEKEPNPAMFIEVPKPVSAMGAAEKEIFIEQIVQALGESISESDKE